jgi:dual specificity phosphatase 12
MNDPTNHSEETSDKVIVVGRNRPRLSKIMGFLHSEQVLLVGDANVEYIPCLAAMDSYVDENGNDIRYLSQMVHMTEHGRNAPMTDLMDDESLRLALKCVVMVGYEWLAEDQLHIEKYFAMYEMDGEDGNDGNKFPVVCVTPNNGLGSLQEEMEAFKNLEEDAKAEANSSGTMGPGKMAQFARQTYRSIVGNDIKLEVEETLGDASSDTDETTTFQAGEQAPEANPALHIDPSKPMFACRICRTVLFGQDHLVENHVQSQHSFHKLHKLQSNGKTSSEQKCQSLFCDEDVLPLFHSNSDHSEIEGRLQCPHCNYKLGHWNWSGAQCSCGTWVVPAIQLTSSKVDIILPQNVDVAESNATFLLPVITPVL